MEQLIAITALFVSASISFLGGIAAALVYEGKLRYPLVGNLAWFTLSAVAIALSFLAGRIWP